MRSPLARLAALALAAFVVVPSLVTTSGAQGVGLPANVVDYPNAVAQDFDFPSYDAAGRSTGKAHWRVVQSTGNCCENYVTSTPGGRLLDMGGTFIRFTDNLGKTWKEVRSISRTINGEGALSPAPGGDVVGVTWDPYSGDHAIAFKYDAELESWTHSEAVLKTPFFDRPWFAVIPGPFTFGTIEAEYITILRGGWPSKDVMYISYDGLNYFQASQHETQAATEDPIKRWLDFKPADYLDWVQPNTSTGITALPRIGALSWNNGGNFAVGMAPQTGFLMEAPEADWDPFVFRKGKFPEGNYLADSRGRLHRFTPDRNEDGIAKAFTYHVSANGGRDWTSTRIALPERHYIEDYDFKVNAKLGIGAIAIHAHRNEKKEADEADQDLVYELDITRDKVAVKQLYYVGAGDANVGAGLGASLRFDFATIAILPDRTIVTSFVDKMHTNPALAFLLR